MNFKEFYITENISDDLKKKYPNIKIFVRESPKFITLESIQIPKEERNKGIGTKFMKDLISMANKKNKTITLTPSKDFGGTVSRLKKFYKSFGFVENKGKNKDFEISDTFYKVPD